MILLRWSVLIRDSEGNEYEMARTLTRRSALAVAARLPFSSREVTVMVADRRMHRARWPVLDEDRTV